MTLTDTLFENAMNALGIDFSGVKGVAVGVSGGPDSMALCAVLHAWCMKREITLHVLHVDHGLRDESADEAVRVMAWVSGFEGVKADVLQWGGDVDSAIQEEARKARYGLIQDYCTEHGIAHVFLAHHQDDQAETVLFRLAKGSGLDGLSGMRPVQPYERLSLVRPLLNVSKAELVSYCEAHGLSYLKDPSNQNDQFARVRLRDARAVLEKEGLSSKRLATTAARMARAREALDVWAEDRYKTAILQKDTKHIVLNLKTLLDMPEEVVLRCVIKAIEDIKPESGYGPRMEKLEGLVNDLISQDSEGSGFRKRTLGGLVYECDQGHGALTISLE